MYGSGSPAFPDNGCEPSRVVVVDDVARFPLHVWRYLSRSIGYGIGDVRDDGSFGDGVSESSLEGRLIDGLASATGDLVVQWVPLRTADSKGRDGWLEHLASVARETSGTLRRFLIDVRGPYPRSNLWYSADKALEALSKERVDLHTEVRLVSSYEIGWFRHGEASYRIHPKSAGLLQELMSELGLVRRSGAVAEPMDGNLHVLLTGAGMELRSGDPTAPFGMPGTEAILETCLSKLNLRPEFPQLVEGLGPPYPVPKEYNEVEALLAAATDRDLDDYWSQLLTFRLFPLSANRVGNSGRLKLSTLRKESKLREAFRQVFLDHDWGFVDQVLAAVQLPWQVWVTTNYTRFVDRAIALIAAHSRRRQTRGMEPWRTVSTSNEAASLLKEVLHASEDETTFASMRRARLLFKLHGDLAHLSTMAIAGDDKDITTPFAVPVDSLHWIYSAMEQYLTGLVERRARESDDAFQVYWHVVGHSLRDRLLWSKLVQIVDRAPSRHTIMIVDPVAESLAKEISNRTRKLSECRVIPWELPAGRWLAALHSHFDRTGEMWRPVGVDGSGS